MKLHKIIFALYCIFSFQFALAQREFNICDSTFYTLNADTTIVAGQKKLYYQVNNSLQLIYDFTTLDTNTFIRDFDIVKPNLWYTIVGSRYIGGPTQLFKSINKGLTWTIDTAHYNTPNLQLLDPDFIKSINNLQHINGDTLMMFMHYYESGIIYSTDAGLTWKKWFDNLIAHYQGMLACENKYYIYGYEGDAFKAWMFGFDKALFFSSDSTGLWNSFNNNGHHPKCSTTYDTVNCVYATGNLSRCASYNFFKTYINNNCSVLSTQNILQEKNFSIFPNPTNGNLTCVFSDKLSNPTIQIIDIRGQIIYTSTVETIKQNNQNKINISVSHLPHGRYMCRIIADKNVYVQSFMKL